jgi:hypothetical protein
MNGRIVGRDKDKVDRPNERSSRLITEATFWTKTTTENDEKVELSNEAPKRSTKIRLSHQITRTCLSIPVTNELAKRLISITITSGFEFNFDHVSTRKHS